MKNVRTSAGFGMTGFKNRLYMLNGKTPVECHDYVQWADAHSRGLDPAHGHPWRVGLDRIGELEISTVFLGMDMSAGLFRTRDSLPVLFETMLFGLDSAVEGMGRSSTYDEAQTRHRAVVARVKAIVEAGEKK